MKRLVLLMTVLVAFAFTAMAQDASSASSTSGQTSTKSAKSSKKKSSDSSMDQMGGAASSAKTKTSTLTGCVSSSAGSDGNYSLANGRYKNGVSLMPTDKVKDHAGHQVSLKGTWSSDKKSFNVDSVKHISDTCSAAPGGGTTGMKSGKGSKKKSGDSSATPKGF